MQEDLLVEKMRGGRICFVKQSAPDFDVNVIKTLAAERKGIVLLADEKCKKLVDNYKEKGINMTNLAIFSTSQNSHDEVEHVSSLAEASLLMSERINKIKGKQFIVIRTLQGLLKNNKAEISEKFIHYLLTKMRIENIGGFVLSGKVNKKEVAGIIQLFDDVVHV